MSNLIGSLQPIMPDGDPYNGTPVSKGTKPTLSLEEQVAALKLQIIRDQENSNNDNNLEPDMATSRLERRPSLLNTDDVDKLYHHFLRIDEDGNGLIDKDELLRLPMVRGNPLAVRLMELFDTDQSGDINFAEFVAGLSIFSSKTPPGKKLKFAFDVYDLDGDGYISNGELFVVLKMMTGEHLKPIQLQQIVDKTIRDADKDGDGKISFDEFYNIVIRKNSDLLSRWSVSDL